VFPGFSRSPRGRKKDANEGAKKPLAQKAWREIPREAQQEQFLRDMEIDSKRYYAPDVEREVTQVWPKGIGLNVKKMVAAAGGGNGHRRRKTPAATGGRTEPRKK
jgi:hypothetical protein